MKTTDAMANRPDESGCGTGSKGLSLCQTAVWANPHLMHRKRKLLEGVRLDGTGLRKPKPPNDPAWSTPLVFPRCEVVGAF